jgi:hypothetical protein
MRLLDYLNRRYTVRESLALLALTIAVVLGAPLGFTALGIGHPAAAVLSLILALGAYFIAAAVIDRRTRG